MKKTGLATILFAGMLGMTVQPSGAFISGAIFLDNYMKKQAKIARGTPGHAKWCAQNHKGYRAEWNTYPVGDGRVSRCASPYYTPPWKRGFKRKAGN